MKKIAAILLLGIFVFNMFGYKLWLSYMEHKADISLETAMDNNQYNSSELISIKKALHLPYYNNTTAFTRMDGEVEVNGMYYKYVKCRIYNDSLELLCIPNAQKAKIIQAKEDFFKVTADIQKKNSEKNKSTQGNTFKKILSECIMDEPVAGGLADTIVSLQFPNDPAANLGLSHKRAAEQPPDTVLFTC